MIEGQFAASKLPTPIASMPPLLKGLPGSRALLLLATESRLSQAERPLVSFVFAIRNSKGGDAGLYQTSQFSQSDDVAIDAEP